MSAVSRVAVVLLGLLVFGAGGCFEKEGWAPTQQDNVKISDNVLKSAPQKMDFEVNAELEDRMVYLGLDVSPKEVRPGQAVTLTHYWQVKKAITNWKLFVHLIGPGTYVNADHKPVGGLYPVSQWKPGQIIRDRHSATVPADYRHDEITVYVGLWQGKRRMAIKKGPQDDQDRVRAAVLKVLPR